MAMKDILVHVDNSKAAARCVEAAAMLANRHDGHLTGLYVFEIPVLPGYAEAQVPASILKAQRKGYLAQAKKAEKRFAEVTERAGVSAEWRCVEGKLVDTLKLHGRYMDLLVVNQADEDDPRSTSKGLADKLVLESGRPVLVVPRCSSGATIGDTIMVAWNARREAVRAISDAMPLLQRARSVKVVTVNAQALDPEHAGIPVADIGLHLARHGITTEAKSIHGAPAAIGKLLLDTARDEGADLIVMGAYGHARFREIVLGGATAHVLAHAEIPALLAH